MKDKVVVITGGSSGIGFALAERFGYQGSNLVITGRDENRLSQAKQLLSQKGISVLTYKADTVSLEDNMSLRAKVLETFGRVDVIVANAGISMRAYFEDCELEVVEKLMDVNFFGALRFIKVFLPEIIKNQGYVVGISSVAGYRGLPGRTGYCASKFALHGFLESLRTEVKKRGVTVLIVSPGYVASNIRATALLADGNPQGSSPRDESKMMSAEKCAQIIYDAVRAKKSILVMTLKDKMTILLNRFFPLFMDNMVIKALTKEEGSIVKTL